MVMMGWISLSATRFFLGMVIAHEHGCGGWVLFGGYSCPVDG